MIYLLIGFLLAWLLIKYFQQRREIEESKELFERLMNDMKEEKGVSGTIEYLYKLGNKGK